MTKILTVKKRYIYIRLFMNLSWSTVLISHGGCSFQTQTPARGKHKPCTLKALEMPLVLCPGCATLKTEKNMAWYGSGSAVTGTKAGARDAERLRRGKGKSDSSFNIRLAGNVFLHRSVCLCVHYLGAVSFIAQGITHLSTDHKNIKKLTLKWRCYPKATPTKWLIRKVPRPLKCLSM